jgi:hypothetical protein
MLKVCYLNESTATSSRLDSCSSLPCPSKFQISNYHNTLEEIGMFLHKYKCTEMGVAVERLNINKRRSFNRH